ncbi:hypothetical protein ACQ5SO_04040 [Rhodovulum sp. DZ06]|uniref:hypothetical protein n=1 Tax=Rhodovulum sp. DZ06 TaxID=3425126 RepID=UPI003D32CC60
MFFSSKADDHYDRMAEEAAVPYSNTLRRLGLFLLGMAAAAWLLGLPSGADLLVQQAALTPYDRPAELTCANAGKVLTFCKVAMPDGGPGAAYLWVGGESRGGRGEAQAFRDPDSGLATTALGMEMAGRRLATAAGVELFPLGLVAAQVRRLRRKRRLRRFLDEEWPEWRREYL